MIIQLEFKLQILQMIRKAQLEFIYIIKQL